MADKDTALHISVDASDAKRGIGEVKTEIASIAPAAQQAGAQASKGIDQVGSAGDQAAAKLDRSTKSMIGSIERATAALKSGGQQTRAYYETLAQQRGISGDALKPYLDQLEAAAKGQQRVGVSAAQMQAALRGVPAQFTDIATSLASGQAPLTVFLQQGGQLKDMFGGLGPAARALGGYIVGLVNPLTLTAAAVAALGVAYVKGAAESEAYNRALILTGNAAGLTVDGLSRMAATIGKSVGTTSSAAAALAELAGSTKLGAANLQLLGEAAVRMERAIGQPVAETRKAFEELAKAPTEASATLNEASNYLTASIYKQIKALEDQGRTSEAAKLAVETYASTMVQRTKQIEEGIGSLERVWKSATDAAKSFWSAALKVGRPDTLAEQIKKIDEQIAAAQGRANRSTGGGLLDQAITALSGSQVSALTQQRELLQEQIRLQQRSAAATAEQSEREQARIKWLKDATDYLSKEEKLKLAIKRIENEGAKAGASREEIDARVAAEKQKILGKEVAGTNRELEQQEKLIASLSGLNSDFYAQWNLLTEAWKRGRITSEQLRESQAALLAKQPAMTAAAREEEKARNDAAKAAEKQAQEYAKAAEAQQKSIAAIGESAQKLEDEAAKATMSASAYARLTYEREQANDEARKQALIATANIAGTEAEIAAIEREIEALERRQRARSAAYDAGETKRANDANKAMLDAQQRDYERFSDQVGQALANALMDGGKSGLDYIKGIFRTAVLQPLVKPIANSISSSVSGIFGGTPGSTGGMFGSAAMGDFMSSSLASGLGYAAAAYSLSQGNYTTAALTAIGTAVAGPIGAAVGQILGGMIDGAGETRGGSSYGYSATGGVTGSLVGGLANNAANKAQLLGAGVVSQIGAPSGGLIGGEQGGAATAASIAATVAGINTLFAKLGSTERIDQFYASLQTSTNDRGGVLTGGRLSGGAMFGDAGLGSEYSGDRYERQTSFNLTGEQAIQAFALDLQQSVIQALQQATDIQPLIRDALAGIDAEALTQEQVTSLLQTVDALVALTDAVKVLGINSDELTGAMVSAAGGVDGFTAGISTYYAQFYTDAERTADVTEALTNRLADLGLTLPTTREAFRALVEAQDLTTEAGQRNYGALVALSGAFAELVPAVDAATSAVAEGGNTFAELARAMDELNPPAASLVDTWRSTRSEVEALQKALDQALGVTVETSIERLQSLQAQAAQVASARSSIGDRVFELQVGSASPADAARMLKAREDALWAGFGSSANPAAAAQALADITIRRIKADAIAGRVDDTGPQTAALTAAQDYWRQEIETQRTRLDALGEQRAAINDQLSALQRTRDFAQSIGQFATELQFGALSPLNPQAQVEAARANFFDLAARARGGDQFAQGAVQGAATSYLEQARQFGASGTGYVAEFQRVMGELQQLQAMGAAVSPQIALAERQAKSLEAQQAQGEKAIAAAEAQIQQAQEQLQALRELQNATIDTSAAEVAALQTIDAALAGRETQLAESIGQLVARLEKQIAALESREQQMAEQIAVQYEQLRSIADSTAATAEGIDTMNRTTNALTVTA